MNPTAEFAIDLAGLHKSFAGQSAIQDITLRVPAGGIFGLLGHNGAGKSTTLGIALGLVFPDEGTVRLAGCDVLTDRANALSRVGAIFESPQFYDYLSGRRNLRILADYSGGVTNARLDEVIELVGLGERIDDRVVAYSHGMRQRLALAQALLPGPDVLILDEPTDGLDPAGIAEFRQTLVRLRADNAMTILFSSHLLDEVERLCEDVTILHHGRQVFTGAWRNADAHLHLELELDDERDDEAFHLLRRVGLVETTAQDGQAGAESGPCVERPRLGEGVSASQVNATLVSAGFGVRRLAATAQRLEDFYLRVVAEDSAPDRESTSFSKKDSVR